MVAAHRSGVVGDEPCGEVRRHDLRVGASNDVRRPPAQHSGAGVVHQQVPPLRVLDEDHVRRRVHDAAQHGVALAQLVGQCPRDIADRDEHQGPHAEPHHRQLDVLKGKA